MAFEGANPDQLDQLADQFHSTAQRLEDIRANVTRRLGYSSWKGPAADRFRHQWTNQARSLDACANALEQARKVLNDNANQQRHASGEATVNHGGGGIGGLFGKLIDDGKKIIGAEAKAVHDVVNDVVHGAEAVVGAEAKFIHDAADFTGKVLDETGKVMAKQWDDFVKSPVFDDIMEVAKVVSAVAPIIAVICPVAAPALLAIAAAAAIVVFAGDVIKMANSGKWDAGTLAIDGASAVLSVVGAGALGTAAKAAGEAADGVSLMSKGGLEAAKGLSDGGKALLVLRTTKTAMEVGQNGGKVVTDLQNQNYGGAVLDGVGAAASTISGLHGAGAEDASMAEKLIAPTNDLIATDADLTHEAFYNNEGGESK